MITVLREGGEGDRVPCNINAAPPTLWSFRTGNNLAPRINSM